MGGLKKMSERYLASEPVVTARLLRYLPIYLQSYFFLLLAYEVQGLKEIASVLHLAWIGAGLAFLPTLWWELHLENKRRRYAPKGRLMQLWARFIGLGPAIGPIVLILLNGLLVALFNHDVDFTTQIKALLLNTLALGLFFPGIDWLAQNGELFQIHRALRLQVCGITILNLVAVVQFIFGWSFVGEAWGLRWHLGTLISRYDHDATIILYGLYVDSNHAALFTAVALLMGILFLWQAVDPALLRAKKGSKPCRKFDGEISAAERLQAMGMVREPKATEVVPKSKSRRRWSIALQIAGIIINFVYFALANSRGGLLSFVPALLLLGILLWRYENAHRALYQPLKRWLKTFAIFILPLLILWGGVTLVRSWAVVHVEYIARTGDSDLSAWAEETGEMTFEKGDNPFKSQRISIWSDALQVFIHNPWGTGPDQAVYRARELGQNGYVAHGKALHNSYLDVLVSYGLQGFLIYAWMIFSFWWRLWFNPAKARAGTVESLVEAFLRGSLLYLLAGVFLISAAFVSLSYLYALILGLLGLLWPSTTLYLATDGSSHSGLGRHHRPCDERAQVEQAVETPSSMDPEARA